MADIPQGICTISSALLPPSVAVRRSENVVASRSETGVFDVQNVGENIYRIKVPDENLVWSLLETNGERIIFLTPDENEEWQRFRILSSEGPLEGHRIVAYDGGRVLVLGFGSPAGDAVNIAGFPEVGGPAVLWNIRPEEEED